MQRALSGDFALTQGLADASSWNVDPDQQLYLQNDYSVANFPCPSPSSSAFLHPYPPATPLSLSRLISLDRGTSVLPGALPDSSLCPPVLQKTTTQDPLGPTLNYSMDMLFPLPSPLALVESSQDSDITVGTLSASQPSDSSYVSSPHSSFDQFSYLSWGTESFDDSSSVDASIAPLTPQFTHSDSVETAASADSDCDFEPPLNSQSDASPSDCESLAPSEDVEIQQALHEDSPLCDVYKAVLASHPHEGRYGFYSKAERQAKIQYYREKRARARASYGKKIMYQCRFTFAVERPRVGGRFTKKTEGNWSETDKLSLQRRLQAKEQKAARPKARTGRPKSAFSKTSSPAQPSSAPAASAPAASAPTAYLLFAAV